MAELDDDDAGDYEIYRSMRKERQASNAEAYDRNRVALQAAGIQFIDKGQTLLIRPARGPRADFYPSTGRWKCHRSGRFLNGGADRFVTWYRENGGVTGA